MYRWRFALLAAIPLLMAASCPSLPDSDGDGIPDLIDPCPTNPDPTCVPAPTPGTPYDCENPPALTGLVKVAHPIANRYIVVLKATRATPRDVLAVSDKIPGATLLVRAFAATMTVKELQKILADPAVQYVQEEGKRKLVALSWGLDRVDQRTLPLDKAFAPDGDGAGVDVYINDTGVTKTADLGDRLSSDCFSTILLRGCDDGHGHGTHVAGTAAGTTWGIAKKAIVHSVRFLDEQGSGTDTDAIKTLDWIAQHPGKGVVNASWGGDPAPAIDAAVCNVIASGKVFVAAAGNESADAYNSTPARVMQVITVGAMDSSDSQAYFSNFGPGLDLYAPGVDIESDTPAGGTTTMSGTSMATPHVVGGIALLMAKYPGETPAQLRDRLVAAATKDALKGLGAGSPNLLLFVGKASEGSVPPKGEAVGPDRLLRTGGARLRTLTGEPVLLNMGVQCCRSLVTRSVRPPRPAAFRTPAGEINTLWPLISEGGQDYFREKGATNAYHFRMGPFYTDTDTEVDWAAIGGPYAAGGAWNAAFWEKTRELAWHAYEAGAYVEVVPIDTWACKYSQAGNRYMPWAADAIQACGRAWHPEHERYARKVVEELGCFGNVIWALDNEGQGVRDWKPGWFDALRESLRRAEHDVGCGMNHITGTSMPGVSADYSITHVREPITAPIGGRWTLNNERNPTSAPSTEAQYFASARAIGQTWALWRDDMDDAAFEDALARFKTVVEGAAPKCAAGTCPLAARYINAKLGQHNYLDSTERCRDQAYCEKATGVPGTRDCALGAEGTEQRRVCELEHSPGCLRWQFQNANGTWERCLVDQHPVASCDHFDAWIAWRWSDPNCQHAGCPEEPNPYLGPCETRADGAPIAGNVQTPHGKTNFRACDTGGTVCSNPIFADRGIDAPEEE